MLPALAAECPSTPAPPARHHRQLASGAGFPPGLAASSPGRDRRARRDVARDERAHGSDAPGRVRGDEAVDRRLLGGDRDRPGAVPPGVRHTPHPRRKDSMAESNPLTAGSSVHRADSDPFVFYSSTSTAVTRWTTRRRLRPRDSSAPARDAQRRRALLHLGAGAVADRKSYRQLYRGPDRASRRRRRISSPSPADTGFAWTPTRLTGELLQCCDLPSTRTTTRATLARVARPVRWGWSRPRLRLDLRILTTPEFRDDCSVAFTLPSSRRSRIELFGPSGRRLGALEARRAGRGNAPQGISACPEPFVRSPISCDCTRDRSIRGGQGIRDAPTAALFRDLAPGGR